MKIIIRSFNIFVIFWNLFDELYIKVEGGDACDPSVFKTSIPGIQLRGPSQELDSTGTAICDRYLSKAWYRIDGYQLPDKPPQPLSCMTIYPIWRKGDLPSVQNETKDVEMCTVDFSNTCKKTTIIKVKKCKDFLVYELKPLDYCSAAYCFGVNEIIRDVSVKFYDYVWTRIPGENGKPIYWDSSIRFLCKFTPLLNDSVFYKVTWKLDDLDIDLNQVVNRTMPDTAFLTAYDMLDHGKKIGTTIRCFVAPTFNKDGDSCLATPSPPFFAGYRVQNTVVRLKESNSTNVFIQPTVPFADFFIDNGFVIGGQPLAIELIPPSQVNKSCEDINTVYQKCRQEVDSLPLDHSTNEKWNKTISFPIHAKQSDKYDIPDREVTLLLRTTLVGGTNHPRRGNLIFDNVELDKVIIQKTSANSDVLSKECSSLTDPHVMTFDKVQYECQEHVGPYLLYRNTKTDQEVLRAGRDVFVIDICDGGSFDIVDYTLCDDKILTVVKVSDMKYEIRMPSGTIASVSLRKWPDKYTLHLDIVIIPSLRDFKNTQGLCGIFDDNQDNDFTRSNGVEDVVNTTPWYFANRPKQFSKSWQFGDGEGMLAEKSIFTQDLSLFNNYLPINQTNVLLCTCEDISTENKFGRTQCSHDHAISCLRKETDKIICEKYTGPLTSNPYRKKRAATDDTPTQNDIPGKRSHNLHRRQVYTLLSASEAEKVCLDAFAGSDTLSLCQEHTTQMSNTSLMNCVRDVMMTGDENITDVHVEASTDECTRITTYNATIEAKDPQFFNKISNMCPLNCSNHGSCNNGTCTCDEGFSGSDCSYDHNSLPDVSHMDDFVLCDKAERLCEESILYGRFFFDNAGLRCFIKRSVDIISSSIKYSSVYNEPLKTRTILEGRCPLVFSDIPLNNTWIFTFEFNITNDGQQFSETMTTVVYDSVCQKFQNVSGSISFELKNGYCFIDNVCYLNGNVSSTNNCWVCDPDLSAFDWTYNEVCRASTTTTVPATMSISTYSATAMDPDENKRKHPGADKNSQTYGIIGAFIGSLVAVVVLATIGVMLKQKFTKRVAAPNFSTEDSNINPDIHALPKEIFDPTMNLFSFSGGIYSRPPSSTSMSTGPATVDLSNIYNS